MDVSVEIEASVVVAPSVAGESVFEEFAALAPESHAHVRVFADHLFDGGVRHLRRHGFDRAVPFPLALTPGEAFFAGLTDESCSGC